MEVQNGRFWGGGGGPFNALFGQFKRFKADYRVIPAVTFLDPEIARVGLNEREAREQGVEYEVTRYELDGLDRAIADSERQGFVKVLTPPGKDTILGATVVGAHAGELLAEYVLAMKHKLGLNKILGTIHSYPTMAEANKFAAGEWKKKHKPEALLALATGEVARGARVIFIAGPQGVGKSTAMAALTSVRLNRGTSPSTADGARRSPLRPGHSRLP